MAGFIKKFDVKHQNKIAMSLGDTPAHLFYQVDKDPIDIEWNKINTSKGIILGKFTGNFYTLDGPDGYRPFYYWEIQLFNHIWDRNGNACNLCYIPGYDWGTYWDDLTFYIPEDQITGPVWKDHASKDHTIDWFPDVDVDYMKYSNPKKWDEKFGSVDWIKLTFNYWSGYSIFTVNPNYQFKGYGTMDYSIDPTTGRKFGAPDPNYIPPVDTDPGNDDDSIQLYHVEYDDRIEIISAFWLRKIVDDLIPTSFYDWFIHKSKKNKDYYVNRINGENADKFFVYEDQAVNLDYVTNKSRSNRFVTYPGVPTTPVINPVTNLQKTPIVTNLDNKETVITSTETPVITTETQTTKKNKSWVAWLTAGLGLLSILK